MNNNVKTSSPPRRLFSPPPNSGGHAPSNGDPAFFNGSPPSSPDSNLMSSEDEDEEVERKADVSGVELGVRQGLNGIPPLRPQPLMLLGGGAVAFPPPRPGTPGEHEIKVD